MRFVIVTKYDYLVSISDIIFGIYKLISKPSKKKIPYHIFNIGSNRPRNLQYYVNTIENKLKKQARISFKPLQKGDMLKTHANVNKLKKYINYKPSISLEKGVSNFIEWFKIILLRSL